MNRYNVFIVIIFCKECIELINKEIKQFGKSWVQVHVVKLTKLWKTTCNNKEHAPKKTIPCFASFLVQQG